MPIFYLLLWGNTKYSHTPIEYRLGHNSGVLLNIPISYTYTLTGYRLSPNSGLLLSIPIFD